MAENTAKTGFKLKWITYSKSEGLQFRFGLMDYVVLWVTLTMNQNYDFIQFLMEFLL